MVGGMAGSKRQGARMRHSGWAIKRAEGMSYRQIARESRPRVSTMAVYLALNPEKRTPYVPKPKGEALQARHTRLTGEEWEVVSARARRVRVTKSELLRRILLGVEEPIRVPLPGEPELREEAR